MFNNLIDINVLLKAFKDKGYNVTTKRESGMERLVYDNIVVATFDPDVYTYNDYDIMNIGNITDICGIQRLYVESIDIDVIVQTVIDSINKYLAKSNDLIAKKDLILAEKMKTWTALTCINNLILNETISMYLTGYCALQNGQICWGTIHGKIGVIIVNSDKIYYFKQSKGKWTYFNNLTTLSIQDSNNLKECLNDINNLPMKRTKKYWKFTWKTLMKYAAAWIPNFSVGNKIHFLPR